MQMIVHVIQLQRVSVVDPAHRKSALRICSRVQPGTGRTRRCGGTVGLRTHNSAADFSYVVSSYHSLQAAHKYLVIVLRQDGGGRQAVRIGLTSQNCGGTKQQRETALETAEVDTACRCCRVCLQRVYVAILKAARV